MKSPLHNKLKSKRFKLTPKRAAILDYFAQEGKCLTPESVWENLKKSFRHLGLPSIYRNLEVFESCGILVRIQREDRRLYYALCQSKDEIHHHHHHILCVKCGKVDDVQGCALAGVKTPGYRILKHFLQLEGLCPNCV